MTAEQIASISSVVMVVVQLVKWGVPQIRGPWALATVAGVSLMGVLLAALATGAPLTMRDGWALFSAWAMVTSAAAGVYEFVAKPMRTRR